MDVEVRELFKKSIKTGVAVLNAIAARREDLRKEILSAIDEVASLASQGDLYRSKKLVWEKVKAFGKVDAERTLASTDQLFGSLNGQFPKQKAQAGKLRNEAKAAFEAGKFGDASRKAREACKILHGLVRRDDEEFANSLRFGDMPEWKKRLANAL